MGRVAHDRLNVWRRWLLANKTMVDRLDHDLRDRCDLTLEEYDVLVQLAERPASHARMSDLADALLLARSSCTRLVSRLEQRGWVRREADPRDRRVVWATLTAPGRRRLRRAAVVHLAGVDDAFARHLSDADTDRLGALLDRILGGRPGDDAVSDD